MCLNIWVLNPRISAEFEFTIDHFLKKYIEQFASPFRSMHCPFHFGWWLACSHFNLTVVLQPDTITGDIVFVLQQKEHPKFKRKFDDLYIEHTLTLTEALCGFQFVLTHLDGRQLLIKSNPGEVIKPGKHVLPLCAILSVRRDGFQSLNPSLKYRREIGQRKWWRAILI